MGRLDDIAARNQKALKPRRGLGAMIAGEVVDDILDPTQPPEERRRKFLALGLAVAVLGATAFVIVLTMRTSDEAPGGKVKSANGETVELSTLWSKRRVVVEFYPNKQLDYARERLAELEAARASIDADIIGVIGLTGSHAGQIAEQANVGFPLYGDHAFTVIPDWGLDFKAADATGAATFVVEPGGKISYRILDKFAPIADLPRR